MKLRSFLLASAFALGAFSAQAADLPNKVVFDPAPAYSWTGFYVGAVAGYGFGHSDANLNLAPIATLNSNSSPSGGVFGGTVVAQKQIGSVVLGVQGTVLGGSLKDSAGVSGLPFAATTTDKTDFMALAEVRAGLAFGTAFGPMLAYGSGGFATARSKYTASAFGGSIDSNKFDNSGWTLGAGLDWQTPYQNVILSLKYNYVDLGTARANYDLVGNLSAGHEVDQRFNLLTAGINYKF